MTTPHIHADALRALADGKQLQWQYIGRGRDWADLQHSYTFDVLIQGGKSMRFRVKAVPRLYRVALYIYPTGGVTTATVDSKEEAIDVEEDRFFSRWLTDWIEYEHTT